MKTQNKIKAFIEKKLGIDRHSVSAKIKSFQLGYRYFLVSGLNDDVLGNLVEEILIHSENPKLLKAFLAGKKNAQKDKETIKRNLGDKFKKQVKEQEPLVEEELTVEVNKLQKVREKNQDKSLDKSR